MAEPSARDRELASQIFRMSLAAPISLTLEESADLIAARVAEETKAYDLALQSLTPGGSEFVRNPERCAKFARERLDSANAAMKKAIIERNELRSENERLRQLIAEASAWIGDVPGDNAQHDLYARLIAALAPQEER